MRLLSCAVLVAACISLSTSSFTNFDTELGVAPAHAQGKDKRSASRCVKFRQTMGTDEASVDLRLVSKCRFEVVCSLEWELVCSAPGGPSEKAGKSHLSRSLVFNEDWEVSASASACESDWEIDDVRWSCVPADE